MAKQQEDQSNQSLSDPSVKKDGVTSTFSAATGDTGQYGGEDTHDVQHTTGNDSDKIAERTNDGPAGKSE